jgi:hypothetical protein
MSRNLFKAQMLNERWVNWCSCINKKANDCATGQAFFHLWIINNKGILCFGAAVASGRKGLWSDG